MMQSFVEDCMGKCSTHVILPEPPSKPKTRRGHPNTQDISNGGIMRSISFKQLMLSSAHHTKDSNEEIQHIDDSNNDPKQSLPPLTEPEEPRNQFVLSYEIRNVTNGFII
jgi:hypothetical protein